MATPKLYIVFDGNDLKVTQDVSGTNNLELYPKSAIKGVTPLGLITKPSNANISYSAASGPFDIGEEIEGGTSGATGDVREYRGSDGLILENVVGVFTDGETITGATSTETATVESSDYNPTVNEWTYSYPTVTVVHIDMLDGARLNIELQDVSNQATWSTGDQAGINNAITAINTWLKA